VKGFDSLESLKGHAGLDAGRFRRARDAAARLRQRLL
jgi:hypothetical protein